jgi:hypothetical protein
MGRAFYETGKFKKRAMDIVIFSLDIFFDRLT